MKVKGLAKKVILILLIILVVGLVLIYTGCCTNSNMSKTEEIPATATQPSSYLSSNIQQTTTSTAASTMAATEYTSKETEAKTLASPKEPQNSSIQDSQFTALLNKSGYTENNLSNCRQLIIVDSNGVNANIYMYQKGDSGWKSVGFVVNGYVGRNGVNGNKIEGDKTTPTGLYSIGDAFYIDTKPTTGLNTFCVTSNTYWVDDPNSRFYNQRVEGTDEKDWSSAEHMIDYYVSYKYGFVINYNTSPIIPGKGGAIFFHCGDSGTAGCVAVADEAMLNYLSLLNAKDNPYILIM